MTSKQKPSSSTKFFSLAQNLAIRIQALRRAKGETMEQLAVACSVTRGTIHKIEHPSPGEDISLATIGIMASHFGISLENLFSEIEKQSCHSHDSKENRDTNSVWFQEEDYLAITLLPTAAALQTRADLIEQACLHSTNPQQLEILAKHAARLRQRRFAMISKKP